MPIRNKLADECEAIASRVSSEADRDSLLGVAAFLRMQTARAETFSAQLSNFALRRSRRSSP